MARKSAVHSIRALAGLVRPYRVRIGIALLLGTITAFLEGVGLGLLVPVLHGLGSDGSLVSGNPVIDALSRPFTSIAPENRLKLLMACLLGVTVVKNGAAYGYAVLGEWFRVDLMRSLRCRMFDQYLRVGYTYLASRRAGDLWNDLTTETNRTGLVFFCFIQQVGILFVIAVSVVLLVAISWSLTLVALGMLVVLSLLTRLIVSKSRVLGERISWASARHASVALEAISGMREIRLFGRENHERERFDQAVVQANRANLSSALLNALVSPATEVMTMGLFAVILVMSARLLLHGSEAILPILLTFLFVLYRLMPRVTQFNSNRVAIANGLPGVEAVVRMLSPEGKPFIKSGSRRFDRLRSSLQFREVSFSYDPEDGPVLSGVSIDIPVGRTTAIVGASGAGKSTLVDLIPRFHDPQAGQIAVDGVDLRDLDLTSWRAAIGCVSQETFVFNASIRDNIAYGRLSASQDEIEEASHQANAYAFISAMADGFGTTIGDRGVRLSGGQRQRIAIARAILRNPQILILDEATSSLDTASERLVQEALEELSEDRTVVVVAHRLSTIANADQVVVLEDGRVAEVGTHRALLDRTGVYWRYYSMQFGQATAQKVE